MNIREWGAKKLLILGFGREGQATLRFLRKMFTDADITVSDRRSEADFSAAEKEILERSGVTLQLGPDYLENLERFDLIIKSPGINPRIPEISKAARGGVQLESATRMFFSLNKGKVIAVTGSKGKSTTASLIYKVLQKSGLQVELIGNIGRAALDYLENDSADKIYVFEMSSYQLEDFQGGGNYDDRTSRISGGGNYDDRTSRISGGAPDIAVLVSFFPDHLDYHGSLEQYFQAKMQLIAHPKKNLAIVYNAGNSTLKNYLQDYQKAFLKAVDSPIIKPFNDGSRSKIIEKDLEISAQADGEIIAEEKNIKLKGRHNLENILAVYEVAKLLDVPMPTVKEAIREFQPLEHRLELVGIYEGISFYNDAISTTPESTIAAIDALRRHQPISTLIAGGLDRGYRFEQLAEKIIEAGLKNLILLPETGKAIAEAINRIIESGGGYSPLIIFADNLKTCVDKAFELSPENTICLLSCASPSYNLFINFEDRGRQFKEAVRNH